MEKLDSYSAFSILLYEYDLTSKHVNGLENRLRTQTIRIIGEAKAKGMEIFAYQDELNHMESYLIFNDLPESDRSILREIAKSSKSLEVVGHFIKETYSKEFSEERIYLL